MSITADRVSLSDQDAELLARAGRLMGEALDRSRARRIALVEERDDDGGDIVRVEAPPATLRLLSQILTLMARQQTFVLYPAVDPGCARLKRLGSHLRLGGCIFSRRR